MSFTIKKTIACGGYYDILVNGCPIFRGTKNECTTETQRLVVLGMLRTDKP